METLRIETELERQKSSRGTRGSSENRDSGVADVEVCPCPGMPCSERSDSQDLDQQLKRSALSNSLLDIHEQCELLIRLFVAFKFFLSSIAKYYNTALSLSLSVAGEKPQRRGSVGSLDSGMSISFQSTSASSMSQGMKMHPQMQHLHPGQLHHATGGKVMPQGQPSFLGGLFAKRERKLSQTDESSPYSRTTEV